MFTKNQAKLIKSLDEKKNRVELGLFLVEGEKSVSELLDSDFEIDLLLTTTEFFDKYGEKIREKSKSYEIVNQFDLEKVGTFATNDSAIAVVKQKINKQTEIKKNEILIALDEIKDPGNLGTIIRIADWYGIKNIIASKNTVDFYNPKVITATKGSFTRVSMFYTDLNDFLSKTKLPILGAFLNGENIHETKFPASGILVMGNESNGVSKEIEKLITKKITIPAYGKAESLNVAIATAIILDNWLRQSNSK
ncbi:MAG: RNA methyltransferase [Candidatus Paceibacterota bacterium]|jgi:TrmH family RNA methyltransferase